jgi:hypothetical protein
MLAQPDQAVADRTDQACRENVGKRRAAADMPILEHLKLYDLVESRSKWPSFGAEAGISQGTLERGRLEI